MAYCFSRLKVSAESISPRDVASQSSPDSLAGFGLIPFYIVLGLLGWSSKTFMTLACRCCSPPSRVTGSTILAFFLFVGIDSRGLQAQEKEPVPVDVQSLKALLSTIEGPVIIPKDAIIVPYDPKTAPEKNANQKILLPFDEYQRLWQASQINKGKQKVPSPIGIGVSHATYRCSLGEGDSLTVTLGVLTFPPIAKAGRCCHSKWEMQSSCQHG